MAFVPFGLLADIDEDGRLGRQCLFDGIQRVLGMFLRLCSQRQADDSAEGQQECHDARRLRIHGKTLSNDYKSTNPFIAKSLPL